MDATGATFGQPPPPPSQRVRSEWLTPEMVAEEFQLSLALLERWRRSTPGGPPWYRFGPRTPRYLRVEVEAWAASKRVSGETRRDDAEDGANP